MRRSLPDIEVLRTLTTTFESVTSNGSRFSLRVPAELHRFGARRISEPILLELPAGRAPAQGAVLDVLGVLAPPRGPEHGFDERTWIRRHGVHVVLRGSRQGVPRPEESTTTSIRRPPPITSTFPSFSWRRN